jgi:hypothetical protein
MQALVEQFPGSGAYLVTLRQFTRQLVWECGIVGGQPLDRDGRFRMLSDGTWNKATGRLLVAFLSPRLRSRFIAHAGLPKPGQWDEVADRSELLAALAEIRRIGWTEIPRLPNAMGSFAIPVVDGTNVDELLSLGLHYPHSLGRDEVLQSLLKARDALNGLGQG